LRQVIAPRCSRAFLRTRDQFIGKVALEVGDRSPCFANPHVFPIYPLLKSCDNLVLADSLWQKQTADVAGRKITSDGVTCDGIRDESYELVISWHCLEHMANPIRALRNWRRILKPNGLAVVSVPDRNETFEHRRPLTSWSHILWDYEHDTGEDDLTHIEEHMRYYDHDMDLLGDVQDPEETLKMKVHNRETRTVHHHTWDDVLLAMALMYAGFQLIEVSRHPPFHIISVARKP